MREGNVFMGPGGDQSEMLLKLVASNVGYLKLADLIAAEDTRSARLLNRLSRKLRFSDGQPVYPLKVAKPMLIVVVRGAVNLFRHRLGKETFLKKLGKDSVIGEMPSWGVWMLGTRAVAEGQCEVRILDERAAEKLKRESLELLLRLQGANVLKLSQCLGFGIDRCSRFECKVARFLIDRADEHGIVQGLTHADIAAVFKTHRETVTKAVGYLTKRGWIKAKRRKITLLDRDALREFAMW